MLRHFLLCASVAAVLACAVISPMPYRPGYGLGSWLPNDVINSMRKEADVRSEIFRVESMQATADSLAREVVTASRVLENRLSTAQAIPAALNTEKAAVMLGKIQTVRERLWDQKFAAYEDLISGMEEEVEALRSAAGSATGRTTAFTTFASEVDSPVDWSKSKINPQPRASDSITVNVEFVQFEGTQQNASSASHVDRLMQAYSKMAQPTSKPGTQTTLSHETGDLLQSRLDGMAQVDDIEGTLLFTSFATHRNVQQFESLALNVDQMFRGWNFWHPDDRIADPIMAYDEFVKELNRQQSLPDNERARINLVSEIFKGSSFVGMVHILKDDEMGSTQSEESQRHAQNRSHAIKNLRRQVQDLADSSGYNALETETVKKLAGLLSNSSLRLRFDLICIGFIPKLTTNTLSMAVKAFGSDFDASKFAVTPYGDTSAKAMTMLQSNMGAVIQNTVMALSDQQSNNYNILDQNSFMQAYTDFVTNAQSGANDIGAPVGMNVRQYTKLNIMGALVNKYLNTGINVGMDISDIE